MKKLILFTFLTAGFSLMMLNISAQNENLTSKQLSKDLTVVEGSGGNSGILVTDKAVVVIDTKMESGAEDLYKMVKAKAGNKPIIVINTHYHPDHTSGNHFYKGSKIYIGGYDKKTLEAVVKPEDMPTDFVKDSLVLNLGSETVVAYNMGEAHTWQDMVVLLRKNKVMFTGDLVFYKVNPFVMKDSGADVDKWISDLDKILARNDYQTLVPGHGEPGGKEIARAIRGYFTDMKTAAKDPAKEKDIIAKYNDWQPTPGWATPEITIKYIRDKK